MCWTNEGVVDSQEIGAGLADQHPARCLDLNVECLTGWRDAVSVGMNWRNCTGVMEEVELFSTVIVPAYKEQREFCLDSSVTRREVGKEVLIVF